MAIKLTIDPKTVWGFYPNKGVSSSFMSYLEKNSWVNVPPVPVFRVPDKGELEGYILPNFQKEHEYFLLDGNQRLNAALMRRELLPVILYEREEIIDPLKDGLAPSKNLTSPRRFDVLVYAYSKRKLF